MMLVIESLLRSRSRVSAIDKHEKSDDRMWNRIRYGEHRLRSTRQRKFWRRSYYRHLGRDEPLE